jgi:hypothetical protein
VPLLEVADEVEEPLRCRIVVAAHVEQERPELEMGPVERGRESVELVHRDADRVRPEPGVPVDQRRSVLVKYLDDGVHGLHDVAVPDTQTLVGRLERELVSAVGEPVVEVVQGLPRGEQLRLGADDGQARRGRNVPPGDGEGGLLLALPRVAAQIRRLGEVGGVADRRVHGRRELLEGRTRSRVLHLERNPVHCRGIDCCRAGWPDGEQGQRDRRDEQCHADTPHAPPFDRRGVDERLP